MQYRGSVFSLGNQRVQNMGDGTNPTDAVTLQQMQALMRGASWKASARAASTGNVSLTAPGASMDGVTLTAGDVVLLKNQTAGAENGLYVWNGAATALTRAADNNTAGLMRAATVLVTEGTTNADRAYTQTADNVTLGITTLVWVSFGGGGSVYAAGNGLALAGSTLSVVAGLGVIADGTSTRIDPAVVTRKFAVTVGDGSSTSLAVTHGLGTRDVTWATYDIATNADFDVDAVRTDVNTLTLTFAAAPAASSVRVVVRG